MAKKLTGKQKAFTDTYLDPEDRSTYLNGTQSALKAYNTQDPNTASQIASENLRKPNILSYIEEINAARGIGIEDRSEVLAEAIKGEMQSETVTEQKNGKGEVVSTSRVTRDITPAQRLRAISLANDTEGVKNKQHLAEHVAKRDYDNLMGDLRQAMNKRLRGKKAANSNT